MEISKDKTRIKCPYCKGFICEISPMLDRKQIVLAFCRKCRREVKIMIYKREHITA